MSEVYLPADSQKRLLKIARQTLTEFVRGTTRAVQKPEDPYLQDDTYGAFVTLYKGEELRGCVGNCTPQRPLYETVIDVTEAAASRDSRVAPIVESELDELHLDITVISPLEKTAQPLDLEIGKHGLFIARGGKRGVLLPQVAREHGWDKETFLAQTCVKAGLAKDAWRRPDTEVSTFTALIIEENL